MTIELPEKAVLAEFGKLIAPDWRTGCWMWRGPKHGAFGYGQFRLRWQGSRSAHRLSWIFNNGPIPKGMMVCHKCDVPACVNPNHMFLGTAKDNIRDMISKGRQNRVPKKSHCKNGHAFTDENRFLAGNGTQRCKRCRCDNQLAYKARNLDAVHTYQRDRQRRLRMEACK